MRAIISGGTPVAEATAACSSGPRETRFLRPVLRSTGAGGSCEASGCSSVPIFEDPAEDLAFASGACGGINSDDAVMARGEDSFVPASWDAHR